MIAATLFCAVTLSPLVDMVVTAKYRIATVASCPKGAVARVRKRSVMNAEGPYKPIFPLKGAWNIPAGTFRDEWVGRCWDVEYYDGKAWKAVPTKSTLFCA